MISADTSSRVVSSYEWKLDPSFTTALPEDQRLSRVALEALARRYFHSLSTHDAPSDNLEYLRHVHLRRRRCVSSLGFVH